MTFREWIKSYCDERGMFPEDAAKVAEVVVEDPAVGSMRTRWDDDTSGYPVSMLAILAMTVNRVALDHIDATCPLAWYRPMFDGTAPDGAEA